MRIRQEIETYPTMKLEFEEMPNGFNASLVYREQKVVSKKGGKKGGKNLTANQVKILRAMKDNNKITYQELAERVSINENNVERNLKRLQEMNLVKRIGPSRGGYWEVNED